MRISQINSINFASKAENQKEGKKRYFEYLSKNSANEALMMSKGREEKDGKFKFAQILTGLSAFASGVGASLMYSNLAGEYVKHLDPKTGIANFAEDAGKKFMKNTKIMGGLIIGAIVLGAASLVTDSINRRSAEKTANERGFFTLQDRMKMKTAEEVYENTEKVYDEHVKQ